MILSERALRLEPSATLAVVAKAKAMKREGKPVISFGAGEPDFNSPDSALRYGKEAMDAGHTHYTPGTGIPELREAVCDYYKDRFGLEYAPGDVVIGAGAKILLYEALSCIINPGDEVMVFAPAWVSYVEQIRLCEGKEVILDTSDTGFIPDLDQVRKAITPRTRCIMINTPNNPTGAVYDEKTLKGLAALAVEHDITIIYDEIYEQLVYGNAVHHQIVALAPEARDNIIVINGVSKAYAMTGWRIGYALGASKVMSKIGALQGHLTSNPCSVAQYAALGALKEAHNDIVTMHGHFSARRELILKLLADMPLIKFVEPEGAFYVLVDVREALGKAKDGKVVSDDVSFCERLLESSYVAMVPGSAFYAPGHIRVSYSNSTEDITEGMRRLKDFLETLA
ncbi:MAG: pyridoxal phosphate-dependent aminotransferase [Synergistales bacterium]|nr:pyridoxal phosphate-dependent aminotransferase [Dethiosulfovibrio sp.]NCC95936.1 pyridoxal phosphate-dependent aminotransferase [Synergistales bacterium]